MVTRRFSASAEFSGSPKHPLVRHRMQRTDGSTLLLLALEAAGTTSVADGLLTPGDTFTPIVGPAATVFNTNAARITKTGGKLVAPASSTGANIQGITIGAAGAFNLTAENPDFHAMCVLAIPNDAGSTGIANKAIWTLGGATNNLFNFDTGTLGRTPRAGAAMVAGSPAHRNVTGIALGVPAVVGLTRVGTTAALWLNGVQVSTWTTSATLPDLSAVQMQLLAGHSGQTVWTVLLERIPAGRTAAQAVADAYAAAVAIG